MAEDHSKTRDDNAPPTVPGGELTTEQGNTASTGEGGVLTQGMGTPIGPAKGGMEEPGKGIAVEPGPGEQDRDTDPDKGPRRLPLSAKAGTSRNAGFPEGTTSVGDPKDPSGKNAGGQ